METEILKELRAINEKSEAVTEPKKFKNKAELIAFIEGQIDVKLEYDKNDKANKKRNILYTQVKSKSGSALPFLSLMDKYKIRYEAYRNSGYYWIWVDSSK